MTANKTERQVFNEIVAKEQEALELKAKATEPKPEKKPKVVEQPDGGFKEFTKRCDDCDGNPSCWDWKKVKTTGEFVKVDMCIKRRIAEGELEHNV